MAFGNIGTAGRWKNCKINEKLHVTGWSDEAGREMNFSMVKDDPIIKVRTLFQNNDGAQVEIELAGNKKGIFEVSPEVYMAINNATFNK